MNRDPYYKHNLVETKQLQNKLFENKYCIFKKK